MSGKCLHRIVIIETVSDRLNRPGRVGNSKINKAKQVFRLTTFAARLDLTKHLLETQNIRIL